MVVTRLVPSCAVGPARASARPVLVHVHGLLLLFNNQWQGARPSEIGDDSGAIYA